MPASRTALACLMLVVGVSSALRATVSIPPLGASIYQAGMAGDGKPVHAMVQGDVPVSGGTVACISCHRRSGLGAAEGIAARPLPITGPALLAPRTGIKSRPAYTEASLARAIESGVAADGRALNALMPRYRLSLEEMSAVIAYLQQLGSRPAPGVTEQEIVLATVIGADAPAAEAEAVRRVLARYVEIKNGGSRLEARRAAAAQRHALGERRDRAWRRWRLVTWTVSGPVADWPRQLQQQHDADPPFALLSGTTGHDWSVVHQFCERQSLPCVLPLVAAPPPADHDFYSVYYSAGAQLEARVVASEIVGRGTGSTRRVLVVGAGGPLTAAAQQALLARWHELAPEAAVPRMLNVPAAATTAYWQQLLSRESPDVIVGWLDARQLRELADTLVQQKQRRPQLYTMESFTHWNEDPALGALLPEARHVYPYQLPHPGLAQFPREQVWLRAHGLGDLDVRIAGHVLFACHAVGEQLAGIENNFSQEYFMEGLEHMLDNTSMTTLYPRTSLGPGQRFLSRGAYVTSPLTLLGGMASTASWVEP